MTRRAVMERLEQHREELERLGVEYLAVFGSVARDDAAPDSDIDLLIDLRRPAGLLRFAHLQQYLTSILGHEVDLVPRDSVRPHLEAAVSREARRVL